MLQATPVSQKMTQVSDLSLDMIEFIDEEIADIENFKDSL